ncbi:hypothetical protein [Embleya sp. NPDC059259]|uniref:hypothetical protein n=1 Tax=unclassified Embleya TaxID=2699296 RepID=UPI0036B23BAF
MADSPWSADATASPFDAAAALCTRVHRDYDEDRSGDLVVLGDRPEDFALAQLARQVRGATQWLPGPALAWHHLPLPRRPEPITVVSVSLSEEEIRAHLTDRWDTRGLRLRGKDTMPVTVLSPDELPLTGRDQVALLNAWDMPLSLPVEKTSDGSLVSAVRMPIQVPAPLDAARHRWQVGVISAGHPIPALPDLCGSTLVTAGDERETFVRAADGGITYASNRFDFVPAGASPAGSLAGPRLVWPSLERILRPAGKRARVTKRLLGSRSAVEALAAPAPWALLSHWLPGHDRSALPADSAWELKSGVFLTWEARPPLPATGPRQSSGRGSTRGAPAGSCAADWYSAATTAHGSSSTPSPKWHSSTPAGAAAAATRWSNHGGSRPATSPPGSTNCTRRSTS